jgi:ATP adenylyltransferase
LKAKKTARKSRPKKSAGKKRGDWATQLVKDVWPQERDFFERPERFRYVRKHLPVTGCVFCEAAKADLGPDSLVLARDELVMVVMNKYPYNTGHLLILPLEHKGNIWEFDDVVGARLAWWLKRGVAVLKEVLQCHGFNLGLNHGAVAGAGIPDHLHWHIVPRWGGDTNFFPLIAETKALPETLEQTYNRLRPEFAKQVRHENEI